MVRPPGLVKEKMQLTEDVRLLRLRAVHTSNNLPYVLEKRWINLTVVPAAESADFTRQSSNECFVENVPFLGGDLALSASSASVHVAEVLRCENQAALFNVERTTRNMQGATITFVQLVFAPGYRMVIDL